MVGPDLQPRRAQSELVGCAERDGLLLTHVLHTWLIPAGASEHMLPGTMGSKMRSEQRIEDDLDRTCCKRATDCYQKSDQTVWGRIQKSIGAEPNLGNDKNNNNNG